MRQIPRVSLVALTGLIAFTAIAAQVTAEPTLQLPSRAAQPCPALTPGGTVPFTGLNPAIEDRRPLSSFAKHQIVEIDVTTMPPDQGRAHIAEIQALPARVSTYLPGGHCNIANKDCDGLRRKGIELGTTGSWNWDKDERRILNLTHPASLARIVKGAETAWRMGANYVRVDNIHNPAGSKSPRSAQQLAVIFNALFDVEDRLRADGTIPADRPTGVVAHNNLDIWEVMIRDAMLRRPPVFLTSERTAQLAYKGQGYRGDTAMKAGTLQPTDIEEISAGRRIASALGIPYTVAEFQISHDLAGKPGSTYELPKAYVAALAALPGISEVIVIPSETHYLGRGVPHDGNGPHTLAATPMPADAGARAQVCLSALPAR